MVTPKKYAQKALIILMMLFLYIPCTIKRDAKQILGIPVPQEKSTQNNTLASCVHIKASDSHNPIAKKPSFQKASIGFAAPLIYAAFDKNHRKTVYSQQFFVAPIPIYIQHQQYLI